MSFRTRLSIALTLLTLGLAAPVRAQFPGMDTDTRQRTGAEAVAEEAPADAVAEPAGLLRFWYRYMG